MIQMHPQESIIALSHADNTVNKEKLFEKAEVKGIWKSYLGTRRSSKSMRDCIQSD